MRVTLLSSNYYYLYMFGFIFPNWRCISVLSGIPLEYQNWFVTVGIFGISLCSAEQDQTLRWCQWPMWWPKSCLFALLLVYKHSCSSVQGLPTFVHSFFSTWCNTQTFYVSEKRQLSVRIQGVLFWVFASSSFFFFAILSLSEYAHWCCWYQAAVEQCASWCGLCHICLACSCLKGLQACQFCCRGHFSNVTSHTL